MSDLLALTAELVDIPSVSHHETAIADHIEARLRLAPWLTVERVDDEVVAFTDLGRQHRLILAGHTDTVPANGNERAKIDGDTLWGLGATDMKSGLAVLLELAGTVAEPAVDISYVFYTREEVEADHSGLGRLFRDRPDLVRGDAAILGEPTGGWIEAGCQGSMRLEVTVVGERAHTARPWMGVNAIHRLGPVLQAVSTYEERRPVIDGCEYRETMQAVAVEGGVAGNVVPDRASVTINHRVAPDRTMGEAEDHVRALLEPALGEDDQVRVVDAAPPAAPNLGHPLLQPLVSRHRLPVRAKLGWTDVGRFAAAGIPACNLGPGEPTLAHTRDERVERSSLDSTHAALRALLERGPEPAATVTDQHHDERS